MTYLPNPRAAPLAAGAADRAAARFHATLPGYAPTPLHSLPRLAAELGVGAVMGKDETARLGLPSFKILGASWAVARALGAGTFDELVTAARARPGLTLLTATDGNHGRAVAHVARLLGLGAHVLVPAGTAAVRVEAIAAEGARVEEVQGSYDDAVALAGELAGGEHLLVADTASGGDERVPGWVVEGYATIFRELDEQLGRLRPDLVILPVGVGSLAAAAVRHLRGSGAASRTAIVTVEPEDAACALASARAGVPTAVPGPHRSAMVGLNCGTVSPGAWPLLEHGVDAFTTVSDAAALAGVRVLEAAGIVAGECAGAGVAAARAVLTGPGAAERRAALGVGDEATVLLLLTEGPTGAAVEPGLADGPTAVSRA